MVQLTHGTDGDGSATSGAVVQPTPALARILVLHGDAAVARRLKHGLRDHGYTVETAATPYAGVSSAQEHQPELLLLDTTLAGIEQLELLLRLGDTLVPVFLLAPDEADVPPVAQHQACACADESPPALFMELHAHLQARLEQQHPDHPVQLRFADLTLDAGAHTAWRGQRPVPLTTLEFKLLHEFVSHPRQVLSKDALHARVWTAEGGGNLNVVEVYVKQLRQKLEAAHEPRLLHTIRGAGYVLREA